MGDIDLIRKIGNTLEIPMHRGTRTFLNNSYEINEKNQVTHLRLSRLSTISNSKITEMFNDISKLKFLSSLEIHFSSIMNTLPFLLLDGLEYLDLSNNAISTVEHIAKLPKLKYLNLSNNFIEDLEPLENLKHLRGLDVSYNLVNNISFLLRCPQIYVVFLHNNVIKEIPYDVFRLPFLRKESLGIKELRFIRHSFENKEIYEKVSSLRDSESVFLAGGHLSNIAFNRLRKEIDPYFLKGNPLITPPWDIVNQGMEAIFNYYAQIKKEHGKKYFLFESKLLVIGEGGTGKTTFTRKIQDVDAEMPHDIDTTLGIDVGKWSFHTEFANKPLLNAINFHVNLWDFGGQKLYQGTHQMFFSEKTFYVLIGDTREQKTDFTYWLNTVEQLGGENSALVIVLNKKHGHEQKIDESGYRGKFGSLIKEVIHIDLKHDRIGMLDFQNKVKSYLKLLPGIGDELPSSWVQIREDLSKLKQNFISFENFREVCNKYEIVEASMIKTLSGYFNRIGAFTHYIEDALLQERIYLNSNWLVKTVYKVLDNSIAKTKKGRLSTADIQSIWKDNELHYEVNKLAQLMHKFGLMYHIADSNNYVVPAHLPTVTPYEKWPYEDDKVLQFVYEFDKYMPQGIMSRLIVALHHHITDHDLVWHRGVNIEANGAHAEIIESYGGTNRVEIRISGANKVELLAVIRERFAEVLKPFKKLNYKQLVPCICDECALSNEPSFHEYNLLLKFREKGVGSQCYKTGEVISAEKLLKITEVQLVDEVQTRSKFKTIRIFLASSSELEDDRKAFREFASVENDRLHKDGIYLKIEQWEYFIDSLSQEGLQMEYNKAVKNCDIFLSLFFTKVGKYTAEEFDAAFSNVKATGKPRIYTYFKDAPVIQSKISKEDTDSRYAFEAKLKELGHYKTTYTDSDNLAVQFRRQLDSILPDLINS